MKIAFIGQKGIPCRQGGIEKHVEELATKLAANGFDISVYARPHYTAKELKTYNGINIVNLSSLNTKHLDAISHTFIATIHAILNNYDIIHYHGVGPSLLSFIPRILSPKTKVIATFHCLDREHQKWGRFAKFMLAMGEWAACHFPHETIVVSKGLQQYCLAKFNKETTYIPNGVSISELVVAKKQKEILRKFHLQSGKYFLVVSRLIEHKGLHTLIKAYQKIKTNKKLVIVGSAAHTDAYATRLRKLAGNNKNIIFTGQQSGNELEALFNNAYLFVQPSETEGLSIALMEAVSYNLPVIISDIKENIEVVGKFGWQFKNKNARDLADQLIFADKNPAKLEQLSKLAKKKINKEYDWNKIAIQVGKVYNTPLPRLSLAYKFAR